MKRFMRWRNVDMAEVTGRSEQAVGKWFKPGHEGGKISGKSFSALLRVATARGYRAGSPHQVGEALPEYIQKGDDEVDKHTVQQIFDALPRGERAKWIEYGNLLVIAHAPKGVANPNGKKSAPAKPKAKARGTH